MNIKSHITKSHLLAAALISLLLITQTAHADFRKALDAYQNRDGATMLKEVKDAVDKKNDDGLILFLGIFKQYPKTWQFMLNETQQVELFSCLEKAAEQTNLQVQYKLAVIPRKENSLPPVPKVYKDRETWYKLREQEKLKELQDEVTRLEPIANKGYAPAALQLYGNYANNLTLSKDNAEKAFKWLVKAAELGSPEAAFRLGLKYLNVPNDYYGCAKNSESSLCIPEDESKGWYWMQQAATRVNERNIALGDFAYEMGNLYYQGVAGNKPDLEQAYLWYMLGVNNAWFYTPTFKIKEQLDKMHQAGQLKKINAQLDMVRDDADKRQLLLHPTNLSKTPNLFQIKKTENQKTLPIFSFFSMGWYGWGQAIDIYSDGTVKLSNNDVPVNNDGYEETIKIKLDKANNLIDEIVKLGFSEWSLRNDYDMCFRDCYHLRRYYISVQSEKLQKTVLIGSELYEYALKDRQSVSDESKKLAKVLMVLHKYFPENYPADSLRCNISNQNPNCNRYVKYFSSLVKQGD